MKKIILAMFLLLTTSVFADNIYTKEVNEPFSTYFPKLKAAIQKNHMNIIYEIDLIEKFKKSGYDKKFGADFNRNKLDKVVTLLLCNGYVGNQVSNIDPRMMALCPIRITVIKKGDKTEVVFLKSADTTDNRQVKELLATLDTILIHTIDLGLDAYMQNSAHESYEDLHEGN